MDMESSLNDLFHTQVHTVFDAEEPNERTEEALIRITTDVHAGWLCELKRPWTPFSEDTKHLIESYGFAPFNMLPVIYAKFKEQNEALSSQKNVMDLLSNLSNYNSDTDSDYIPQTESSTDEEI